MYTITTGWVLWLILLQQLMIGYRTWSVLPMPKNLESENEQPRPPLTLTNTSDFSEMLIHNKVFVDKSLLISEILAASQTKAIFITRPRGYGKTLNMDMLRRFFELEVDERTGDILPQEARLNRVLFTGGTVNVDNGKTVTLEPLKVSANEEAMKHHGEVPVLHVSFANVNGDNSKEIFKSLELVIGRLVSKYSYLQRHIDADPYDKHVFNFTGQYGRDRLERSLMVLARLLHTHFNRQVLILIDQFDTPILNAYLKFGDLVEFTKIRDFFWAMYTGCFQISKFVWKGVLTGVAAYQSSNFGIKNCTDHSMFDDKLFNGYYGFSWDEIRQLLNDTKVNSDREEISKWHFGYRRNDAGQVSYYAPWSVMKYLLNRGKRQSAGSFWKNALDLEWFIREALLSADTQEIVQHLALGENVTHSFRTEFSLDRRKNRDLLLDILVFAGYLYRSDYSGASSSADVNLSVPNRNVQLIFQDTMQKWVCDMLNVSNSAFTSFVNLLTVCRMEEFKNKLPQILSGLADKESSDETAKDEKLLKVFYKSFVLCTFREISGSYKVVRQKLIGSPERNILLIPKNDSHPNAIILRYKVVKSPKYNLTTVAEKELERLSNKRTEIQLDDSSVNKIYRVSLAFCKQNVTMIYQHDDLV